MKSVFHPTILSTSYFPPIKYFQCINTYNPIYIEQYENYQRHSIRNRTKILGANGTVLLTVPIKKGSSTTLIKHIEIAGNRWRKNHINSIKSAYGSAPFFIYYFEEIEKIINKNHNFLLDLNNDILSYFLNEFKINKEIKKPDTYLTNYSNHFSDQRNQINLNQKFKKYHQVFDENFTENLSVIDLIFNVGPKALKYICI